jgi:hypothetical protein
MWRQDDATVLVHGSWSGWRSAEVRLADLDDVHWSHPPGAPHPLIHAFVPSARLPKGDLTPAGDPASMRRRLLVCVLKRHTVPAAYNILVRRADARRAATQLPAAVDAGVSGDVDFRE